MQGRLAHLATHRLPPARFPLGRLRASGHATGRAQRISVGSAQQLQRGLAGRAVARRRRGRLLERQEAAAERRAAGLHGALPAVIGTLGAWEGPVLLCPEAHHARPAETVAAVGAHRLAGRALAQGADGLSGTRGERQGCGWRRRQGRGRRGRRRAGNRSEREADKPQPTTPTRTAPTPGTRARGAGSWLPCALTSRSWQLRVSPSRSWQLLSPPSRSWQLCAPGSRAPPLPGLSSCALFHPGCGELLTSLS